MYRRQWYFLVPVLLVVPLFLGAQYEVAEVTNGGTVMGTVQFASPIRAVKNVMTTRNQDYCGATVPDPNASLVNPALPCRGMKVGQVRALRKKDLVRIQCDPHDWMNGYILVLHHA